ncbi:ParA family protein [Halogeometricum limi]|uniref:CobQ/CobB/MinD/ParA nucleotide binding domain-containing protein n=1 Tax=Halogeometricum limi TaxID=555875 RepID=A0A1I6FV45_9EURY|nr:AAA family ATPase [Halogeometricum limi]SFR33822.1 CobQ/CobB/MinD/ParA nucleotide binding domain-containing protein [Halogeometricum limi]
MDATDTEASEGTTGDSEGADVDDVGDGRTGEPTVVTFVGATGGAGTTRSTLEVAAALAVDGADIAVFDAAFATQGVAAHVDGQLATDLTALLTDASDAPLSEGLTTLDWEVEGRVVACPTFAPFERFARAKTPDAARRLESRLADAANRFDYVLVDAPPIAANQAVAAVNAADRVVLVAPGTTRGADAAQRMRTRLAHVGSEADVVVATRGSFEAADCELPESGVEDPRSVPACVGGDGAFTEGVVELVAATVGRDVGAAFGRGGLLSGVERYVK